MNREQMVEIAAEVLNGGLTPSVTTGLWAAKVVDALVAAGCFAIPARSDETMALLRQRIYCLENHSALPDGP